MWSLTSLLIIASLVAVCGQLSTKNIKIVDGVDKLSGKDENELETQEPEPINGPESLYFLNGLCFAKSIDRFEYNVCPFQNITQRRITGQYATILGVWGSWEESKNTDRNGVREYKRQKYVEGKSCGESKVDTTLILECGHKGDFEILAADDNTFCTYEIKLGLPVACSLFQK